MAHLQLSVQSVLVGVPRRGAGGGNKARACKTDPFLKPGQNLQSRGMHFWHKCHGLIGYSLYLVESGFKISLYHTLLKVPGSHLCPGHSLMLRLPLPIGYAKSRLEILFMAPYCSLVHCKIGKLEFLRA